MTDRPSSSSPKAGASDDGFATVDQSDLSIYEDFAIITDGDLPPDEEFEAISQEGLPSPGELEQNGPTATRLPR